MKRFTSLLCLLFSLVFIVPSYGTVTTQSTKVVYAGNNSTGPYQFVFPIYQASDLLVIKTNSSGTESVLALNTDYTVSGLTVGIASGGTVTLTTALASGYTLTVMRSMQYLQGQSWKDLSSFTAKSINDGLDILDMQIQQLKEITDRTYQTPRWSTSGPVYMLPSGTPVPTAATIWTTPQDFGVVGNATVDDTGKLQDAVTASSNLYIPPNTMMRITSGITSTARIHIQCADWTSGFVGSGFGMLTLKGNGSVVEGCTFMDTVGSASTIPIDVNNGSTGVNGFIIRNNNIIAPLNGWLGTGIKTYFGLKGVIEANTIQGFGKGIYLTGDATHASNANDIRANKLEACQYGIYTDIDVDSNITGNILEGLNTTGIYVLNTSSALGRLTVSGNHFENTGTGKGIAMPSGPPDTGYEVISSGNTYGDVGANVTLEAGSIFVSTGDSFGTGIVNNGGVASVWEPVAGHSYDSRHVAESGTGCTRQWIGGIITESSGCTTKQGQSVATLADLTAYKDSSQPLKVVAPITLTTGLTITAPLSIQPGCPITTTGYTLTVNGPFSAGLCQVFSGTGTVIFGPGSVDGINPEWSSAATDTAKVQWAVDTAAASGWIPLIVNRKYTLTAPVNIDRLVDYMHGDFRIIGMGKDAGFYVASNINMFSSNLTPVSPALPGSPVSERISFEGLRFECASTANLLDGNKFLRVKISNCFFYGVNLATTQQYFQSYYIDKVTVLGWTGTWFGTTAGASTDSHGAWNDVHIREFSTDGTPASGAKVFVVNTSMSGCSIRDSLAEGFTGPFLDAYVIYGNDVSGNYFEGIVNNAIKLGTSLALNLNGNYFFSNDPTWYAVDCGTSHGISASGNFSIQNLFNDSNMSYIGYGSGLTGDSNYAAGNLYYGVKSNQLISVGTLTGFTTTVAEYFHVNRSGNTVTLSWDTITGTSNASTMTLTGVIPSKWLPATVRTIITPIEDNGAIAQGRMAISSTGVAFYKDTGGNVFTTSGTKGLIANTITYNMFP